MKLKSNQYYGGFVNDHIDQNTLDDGYGFARCPALYKSRLEAQKRYDDIRIVTLSTGGSSDA